MTIEEKKQELIDIRKQALELREMYKNRPEKDNFTALILGEVGSGKSWLIRSARLPIHVDIFDPGGDVNLGDLVSEGKAILDTHWMNENPKKPTVFKEWEKVTEQRFKDGYYNQFGTVVIDSSSSWASAIMNQQMKDAGLAGEAPRFTHDYMPQKVKIQNWIYRFMGEPMNCDFFLTGHLEGTKDEVSGKMSYRYMVTGKAQITIPSLFDEIYVMDPIQKSGKEVEYRVLTKSTGTYLARSRMAKLGLLDVYEKPDIKHILRKCKRDTSDKPLFI